MDGWPSTWRTLTWLSLVGDAAKAALGWARRQAYQFDPRRRY